MSKLQVHVTFSNMWFDFALASNTSCNDSTFKLKTCFTRSRTFHLNGYSLWNIHIHHSSYAYIVFQMSLTQVKSVPKFYAQIMNG